MSKTPAYLDEKLSFEVRAKDLVSKMTLEEKVTQMLHKSPAIPRLDVPAYNWWSEALHGVARAGTATVFPQAIGMAATFDENLIYKIADIISTEGRAKYHESVKKGDRDIYKGLTFWSPNINIFRDPRWGRGHETYGEDPYLTGRLGVAFVKGIQGKDKKYLKAAACAKHYAIHSGPESERHQFNAVATQKDMRETYLPAFKELVQEAGVEAVMGAYNRTNGEPCCGSRTLLQDILRNEWGFEGHVTSDCWAIKDFHEGHMVTKTAPESCALAVNNGCDTNCGNLYGNLLIAHREGLVKEETIDRSLVRLFVTRMKLGMFDKPEEVPYTDTPYDVVSCEKHSDFSVEVAKKSIVLLKNEGLLPLDKSKLKTIGVIGPNADSRTALEGNYFGTSDRHVTVLDGIRAEAGKDIRLFYSEGCHLYKQKVGLSEPRGSFAEALSVAESSDVVVMCLGLDATIEGEEGDTSNEFASGDKVDLNLPGLQQELLEQIVAVGKPVVLVLLSGSALAVKWADEHVPAIVQAWYPGGRGGEAVASLLFGDYSPSGRLPVTFYASTEELPDFHDYAMKNRTYRYMAVEALYSFGYGLSYTKFEYSPIKVDGSIKAGDSVNCSATVKNAGKRASEETVQLYLKDVDASVEVPKWSLRGVKKVNLKPGEQIEVQFSLTPRQLALIDNDGKAVLEPGSFDIYIGGSQPDARSEELTGAKVQKARFEVTGNRMQLQY
jgi:beta-glucosidase